MFKFKLMHCRAIVLLIAAALAGCSSSCVTIKKPGAQIEWFVGIDTTPTVHPEEFKEYPQIAAESVLSRLRSRDRVYQLLINSDAETKVETFEIAGGKTGVADDAVRIYQSFQAIQRDKTRKITTNLASVLSYVKKVVNTARRERQQRQQQGQSALHEVQYVVVLLTDGLPDGRQTIEAGDWPDEVSVWIFGIKRDNEEKLKRLCLEQMRIPEANLHINRFSAWKAAVKDFTPMGRTKNGALLERLMTGKQSAPGL